MPVIQFGPWLPDQADYQNNGVTVAENVVPSLSGYLPVKDFVVETDALDARPRGAILAEDKDGNSNEFAGDAAKIYENVGNSWTDRSKSGGYSTGIDERWEFVAWEQKILATNWNDNPQQVSFGSTTFSDLTTDFRCRHITVIRDFVVVANTNDSTDGNVPSRVRWSAFNDETDWTVSQSTLSDFSDLKTEPINRLIGGEFGVVFQKNAVWRMTFAGSPIVFQFDEVLSGIGLIAPGAAIRDGSTTYFLSSRGFFALDNGTVARPIGANRVDQFILDDVDEDHLSRISSVIEPGSHRVLFAYPGVGNNNGRPNKIIVYDPTLDRWSLIIQELELVWRSGGTATTLEQLDNIQSSIDDLETSLDSSIWKGSGSTLGIFDENFKAGSFSSATPKSATIETKEFEIHSGHRTRLNAFRPLTEGGSLTAQVASRNRQIDASSFGSALTLSSSGRFTTRENARYHKFRFNLSGNWTRAVGIQILPEEAIRGELRG